MLQNIDIAQVLFLDVECVSATHRFDELEEAKQELWRQKSRYILRKDEADLTAEEVARTYEERAAIYAEFGKIICISVGIVVRDKEKKLSVRLKSFADSDEAKVLSEFAELLNQYYHQPKKQYLCGHNIKEFDVPYICRRMVVHQIPLPAMLQMYGKKPWELEYLLDTMTLWKFGDYKSYTSLKLLAATLGFASPKDDIDGSDVGRVFWEEDDLQRIAHYCEKDVLATVQLLLRYMYMPILEPGQVVHLSQQGEEE